MRTQRIGVTIALAALLAFMPPAQGQKKPAAKPAASQKPAPPRSAADYWPFKKGSVWKYQMLMPGLNSGDVRHQLLVVTVTQVVPEKKGVVATLEYRIDGAITQIEKYRVTSSAILRLASGVTGEDRLDPPFPVVQFPVNIETGWKWKGVIHMGAKSAVGKMDIPAEATITANIPETLQVPAGKFMATQIHVVITISPNGESQTAENDYWFTPQVGLTQQQTKFPTTAVVGILKSFSLAR